MDSLLKKKKSIQELQTHPQGTANRLKNLKPQKQPRINYFAQPPFFFPLHPSPQNKEKVWKVKERNRICIFNSPKEGEANRSRDYHWRSVILRGICGGVGGGLFSF